MSSYNFNANDLKLLEKGFQYSPWTTSKKDTGNLIIDVQYILNSNNVDRDEVLEYAIFLRKVLECWTIANKNYKLLAYSLDGIFQVYFYSIFHLFYDNTLKVNSNRRLILHDLWFFTILSFYLCWNWKLKNAKLGYHLWMQYYFHPNTCSS